MPPPPPELTREAMWEIILDLRATVARLEKRCAKLEADNKALTEQLRDSKRAKAPFTKGQRKADPKPPGRKPGQGNFTHRAAPVPTPEDEVREVDVPLEIDQRQCPQCHTPLDITQEIATIEDTPPQPKRIITRFTVDVGKCPHCDYQTRGQHPELSPTQNGATAHVIGPQVMAQALDLHYGQGLPLRKVPQVILGFTGISLTQSALTQRACRLCDEGGQFEPTYQKLKEDVIASRVLHTDDTGWRINAVLAFVMGFFTQRTAYYQIRWQHRSQEVQEVIKPNHRGAVVTDRASTYRAKDYDAVEMQRCVSHLLTNIKQVEEQKSGKAKAFASELKRQLKGANELWKSYQAKAIKRSEYRQRGNEIKAELTHLLRHRQLSDPDNQRLLDGIGLEHDNGRILLFLDRPEVPPSNNHAERMLRPAVIARKMSQCSKNERGARTYGMMKSIVVTFKLRMVDAVKGLAKLLKGGSFKEACEC
jgi:predicted transcriptional regulator